MKISVFEESFIKNTGELILHELLKKELRNVSSLLVSLRKIILPATRLESVNFTL